MNQPERNFNNLLKKHLSQGAMWQRIETAGTGQGVPDIFACLDGKDRWIEDKIVSGKQVKLSPEQVAWHLKYHTCGGTSFICARYKHEGGPRKGDPVDQILLWPGKLASDVKRLGILAPGCVSFPRPFDWEKIKRLLF